MYAYSRTTACDGSSGEKFIFRNKKHFKQCIKYVQVALRRQQAQEENEARELGLLYSSVPGQQQQQQSDSQAPPSSGYHSGIPSPPNHDHDIGPRVHFSGSESGKFFDYLLNCKLVIQSEIICVPLDVESQRMRPERKSNTYSPDRPENESPGKHTIFSFNHFQFHDFYKGPT